MGYSMRYGYTDGSRENRKPGLNRFVTGERVQIGFMRDLLVLGGGVIEGRKCVLLESQKGVQYVFTPHFGLERNNGLRLTAKHLIEG